MTKMTQEQYVSNKYTQMKYRVDGRDPTCAHVYEGLEICERDEFIQWSLFDDAFQGIWDEWEATDYTDNKIGPSIDRIDPSEGYVFGNMQWKTRSMNTKRANYANAHGWGM